MISGSSVRQQLSLPLLLLILGFNYCQATIECAPPIFRKRSLRRLTETEDPHESPDHDTEGPQILYFFSLALVLGSVTSFLLQRWKSKVPYTVVMFAEGMIAAVLYMHFDQGLCREIVSFDSSTFSPSLSLSLSLPPSAADDKYPPIEDLFDSVEDWGDINPIYLLYMFIPILVRLRSPTLLNHSPSSLLLLRNRLSLMR
jgi:hypothetical protein